MSQRLAEALAAHYAPTTTDTVPSSFAGMLAHLGGARAAAQAYTDSERAAGRKGAGVREFERLRKFERGESGQTRGKKSFESTKAKLAAVIEGRQWDAARRQAKRDGLDVRVAGRMLISKSQPRVIRARITDKDALDDLFDALADGDDSAVEDAFNRAFFDAYGIYGDDEAPGAEWESVDRLEVRS